eukprot:COSAG02_NODE_3983_length_5954_cov_60.916482_4_plen_53_part_00
MDDDHEIGMKSQEFTKPQEAISLFDGKPRMKDTLPLWLPHEPVDARQETFGR